MEGDEGDGLAEAHVVGETAAESERGHQVQPGEAAQLVVAEGGGEAGRRLHVLGAGEEPVAERGERPDGDGGHGLPVHLRGTGEGDGEGVDRFEQPELPLSGLADEIGVEDDPLVPEPHDGPVRLGQVVHLALGERIAVEGQLPVEPQQFLAVEEGGAVGRGAGCGVGGPDDGGGAERAGELTRPVDGDPGVGEPGGGRAEQLVQLVLGDGEDIGHVPLEEPGERGPDTGGPAQGEHGVDPGPGPEVLAVPLPEGRGLDDEGRIGEAVDLEERGGGVALAPRGRGGTVGAAAGIRVEQFVRREVQAERHTDTRVHPGRRLGGPGTRAGQVLGRAGRERRPHRVSGGRGTGQRVGDRVEEGADEGLGIGQPQRPAPGNGHGVRLVRQGGGDGPQMGDVVGVQGSGPPGVQVVGGEPRQHAAAGRQVQGVQGGGPPAGRGGVRGRVVAGRDEMGQGGVDRQGQGGHGTAPCAAAVAPGDGQLDALRAAVRRVGKRTAVRGPEGDPALAGQGGRQEHGGAAHPGVCHGSALLSTG